MSVNDKGFRVDYTSSSTKIRALTAGWILVLREF